MSILGRHVEEVFRRVRAKIEAKVSHIPLQKCARFKYTKDKNGETKEFWVYARDSKHLRTLLDEMYKLVYQSEDDLAGHEVREYPIFFELVGIRDVLCT